MHAIFLSPFLATSLWGKNWQNIFLEPITQILGVAEGDPMGEIFINQGSTINITCIVRNLPEKSSMYWTHNNEVRVVILYDLIEADSKSENHFISKQKFAYVCCCWWFGKR